MPTNITATPISQIGVVLCTTVRLTQPISPPAAAMMNGARRPFVRAASSEHRPAIADIGKVTKPAMLAE